MDLWTTKSTAFLVVTILLGLVLLIGIVGNGLVLAIITTLRRGGRKSPVHLFLFHLAISDLLVCVLCIPLTIFSNFHYPSTADLLNVMLCKIGRFVQFISPTISIAVLTVISIDRYLSLARPILSKAPRSWFFRPNWLLSFAWLYSTLQFLPTFYFSSLVPIEITNSTYVHYCTPIPNKSPAGKIYLILIFLASFVLPMSTMSVLYYRVARVVWNRKKTFSDGFLVSQSDQRSKIMESSRKKVVRMLLIVVAVFFGCWTPFVVYSGFLEERLKGFPNPTDAVRLGLYGLGLSNSICNPFIYYFNGNFNPRAQLEDERRARSSSALSLSYYNGLKIHNPRSSPSTIKSSRLATYNNKSRKHSNVGGPSRAFSTFNSTSLPPCRKLEETAFPLNSPETFKLSEVAPT